MKTIDFKSIVLEHCARYPGMQLEDLYKLAHQAAMGSEHAVSDVSIARQWLSDELDNLPETSAEPLVDIISPDGKIARIHLVPFINHGGEPEKLLRSFIRTANEFKGSRENLRTYYQIIQALAQRGEISVPQDVSLSFLDQMEAKNYPAMHHSKFYSLSYQPRYRVVALKFFGPAN